MARTSSSFPERFSIDRIALYAGSPRLKWSFARVKTPWRRLCSPRLFAVPWLRVSWRVRISFYQTHPRNRRRRALTQLHRLRTLARRMLDLETQSRLNLQSRRIYHSRVLPTALRAKRRGEFAICPCLGHRRRDNARCLERRFRFQRHRGFYVGAVPARLTNFCVVSDALVDFRFGALRFLRFLCRCQSSSPRRRCLRCCFLYCCFYRYCFCFFYCSYRLFLRHRTSTKASRT
mmetsp:Transcript_4236/g.14746  ORF Transcript_4236/g.14746 Transcript_4236/m.14746 type:complete len:233 (-) Transcript_4236:293-991(-)